MESELLELELENRILNGALVDPFEGPQVEVFGDGLDSDNDGESASNGVELAPQTTMNPLTPPIIANEPAAPAKPMRNPARERLKRELGFLRECVVELEAELGQLRVQKRPRAALTASSPPDGAIVQAWKTTVETERAKRRRSEIENERLRVSLEKQLRVATELSQYLKERAGAPHESPTHIPPLLVSSSHSLVVAQFLNDIERAYRTVGSVFPGPSWELLPDERIFVTTVKTRMTNGYEQMYIELLDTAYRSHPYEKACDAAWEATRIVYANEDRAIDIGPSTGDVIAARYRSMGQTRRGAVKDLVVTFVAKLFTEENRSVIVWRTCNNPAQHDSEMPMQAVSDETGWMVLTKVPEGIPNRAAGTAYFQACSRLVPVWFEGDVADSSVRTQLAIGEFTNVVLSATEADVTYFESAFQRLVVDDGATCIEETVQGESREACV